MKMKCTPAILAVAFAAASANAISYDVNRVFAGGAVSLVGTVEVALGDYAIVNSGAHPFSDINLVMTVNGIAEPTLTTADTTLIYGTGVFNIQATDTQLIFNPIGDGYNPADLAFRGTGAAYMIGSNGDPAFERASPGPIETLHGQFPLVWATAGSSSVPEGGASAPLLALALAGLATCRRKFF